jgi:TetR/AcrR family transcriptional regulator, transcriptional repressor of bet genes
MKQTRGRKFRRESAPDRRQALIDATLSCLRTFGRDGASIRRISAHAGVSIGLINHYFPSSALLIAAAYERLATSLLDSIRPQDADVELTARERLSRFFSASFSTHVLDPTVFNAWLVFWDMVSHSPEVRAVHDKTYGAYRAALESLLGELEGARSKLGLRQAAIGLAALLDGLWIELSLNPDTFKAQHAVALCEAWVDHVCTPGSAGPAGAAAQRPKSTPSSNSPRKMR